MGRRPRAGAGPLARRPRGWATPTLFILVTGFVVLWLAAEYLVRHAEPLLRASVIDNLSQRFHSPVELDHLEISLIRGVEVRGSGLRIVYLAGPTQPDKSQIQAGQLAGSRSTEGDASPSGHVIPMLSVRQFSFHLSLQDLLHWRARVATISVDGVDVRIPPRSLNGFTTAKVPRLSGLQPRMQLLFGTILCRNVKLTIETDAPGKQPLVLNIQSVQLTDAGTARPMFYVADVINPKPVGKVHVFGHFGPWQGADPRATPLDGIYAFENADLSTIKGLGGTLSSTGHFTGQLGHIAIEGITSTPNFSLDISAHPESLTTHFQAIVDGTTGDTTLTNVRAKLRNTEILTSGYVRRVPSGKSGVAHDISLTLSVPDGRMEDLLTLGMKTSPPVIRGEVTMQARLRIPPGNLRLPAKLQIAGQLSVRGIELSNPRLQDTVDGLSLRAQGKPQEVKHAESDRRPEVASQMEIQYTVGNALLTVSALRFEVPGATVLLDGVYSMDGNVFEFKGHLRTQAKASQLVSGWKSWLLKPIDPLLEKNGAGVELPISISGTKGNVKMGLALHDADESPTAMMADLKQRNVQTREEEDAKRLTSKADQEDLEAAHEKDLNKAEQIHNQAVRDRAEAQRLAGVAAPGRPPSAPPAATPPMQ